MNTQGDFSAKLHELEAEMAKIAHDFQAKESQVNELTTAIKAAEAKAKEKEAEMEKARQEKISAEREQARKTIEHEKAVAELHALRQQNEKHHAEFQRFKTEYERIQHEHLSQEKKKPGFF